MRLIAVTVAALVLSFCGLAAARPAAGNAGADCVQPLSAVKQLICDDPHLTDLNHRIKAAYHQALTRPGADQTALRTVRKNWKTARDVCAYNADVHSCVLEAYRPAGFGPLTAQFYNQLAPPIAVLNWKGDRQTLFLRTSGGGGGFGPEGAQLSEQQGKGRLAFDGDTFVCRTL